MSDLVWFILFILYPCLLLYEYEIHFKPACLGLDVCLLQAVIIIIFLLRDNILNIYIRESYWMLVNFQCGWQSCSCGSSTHSLKSRRPLTSIPLIFPGLLKLESSVATNSSKILTLSSQTPPPSRKDSFSYWNQMPDGSHARTMLITDQLA